MFLLINLSSLLNAQVPFTSDQLGSDYFRALELFNKEKYPAALRLFDKYIDENKGEKGNVYLPEAEYYSSIAALKVFNADAEYRMVSYISKHPESPRINSAYLDLADYFYQNRSYRKASTYYQIVNRQEISGPKLAEYFFRYGYSLYSTGDKEKALLMFSEIKDIDTEYTPPAVYYFSHIAYEQKMYQTAMDGFMSLQDDETFGQVVPFYIVQILYMQKDYDGILRMAPGLLESAGKERATELYRFIGDAYYNKANYSEALPYLEKYAADAKASGREDKFQLGYSYYKTGDLDKAIKTFLEIPARNDLLSQNIWNILGDCYLQKNDKGKARFAFGEASELNFDKSIKEQALFNYAKLTFETSNSPFGEAIEAFEKYIDTYPGSDRIQEAYNYLVGTYTQLRNYRAALASLDRIRNKDARLEAAYQRVAFYRGLELFRNLQFDASIDMFDRSLGYEKYDRTIRAKAVYWRGEANYRLGKYENARKDYELFIGLPGSGTLSESSLVRYNLGSACFNLRDYKAALSHFTAFDQSAPSGRAEVRADAKNRIADCYFIATDYRSAINYYNQVIDFNIQDADYAMYQKAFSLGLMNDEKGKIDVLTSMIQKYPTSPLISNAILERGRAYVVIEDFVKGEQDFLTVIGKYSKSPEVPGAMVQLGLLYYNIGENDKAISQFKQVIENYKSTPEGRYALTGLRNTYVEKNDVESYFTYVKTLDGYGDIDLASKDSLLYASGENLYMTARYDRAAEIFKNYLNEFPNGAFQNNARFYLAETLRTGGNIDEALGLYEAIISQPNNPFMEQALLSASAILFEREDYDKSYEYYEKLSSAATRDQNRIVALSGQLHSAYEAGDATRTISVADKITSLSNTPEELQREAVFMRAKANVSLNNTDQALIDFRKVANEVTTLEGAESKYMVARLLNDKGNTQEAEKIIEEFINQNTPHQYWMARMFLLLSDISIKKGDIIQARATLQSLRDYYATEDDGILDEVRTKLNSLAVEK